MSKDRNFRPRIVEPLLANGESGFGIEFEFYEAVPGLNGDTIVIHLEAETSLESAEALLADISKLGSRLKITNPS
jgi:hypothetical protein